MPILPNFLPSPRIAAAPTLDGVLIRAKGNENTNWPDITATCAIDGFDILPDAPLNDVQRGLFAAAKINQNYNASGLCEHAGKATEHVQGWRRLFTP